MDQVDALELWQDRNTNGLSPDARVEVLRILNQHYRPINELLRDHSTQFDANSGYSANTRIYLSHVASRTPGTKVHLGRGRAMSTIRNRSGSVWELDIDGSYWHRVAYSYVYWNPDNDFKREVIVVEED